MLTLTIRPIPAKASVLSVDRMATHDTHRPLPNRSSQLFVCQALRDFTSIGAVAPSSGRLAADLTLPVAALAGPSRILEVGAGTGPATRALVPALPVGSQLDVVESNKRFTAVLEDIVASNPAVTGRVHCIDIEDHVADEPYDGIVSALPLTNFAPDTVRRILGRYLDLLVPGGWLTYFAYLGTRHARQFFASPPEAQRHRAAEEVMNQFVNDYGVRQRRVWWNLPPATVHYLRRPAA